MTHRTVIHSQEGEPARQPRKPDPFLEASAALGRAIEGLDASLATLERLEKLLLRGEVQP